MEFGGDHVHAAGRLSSLLAQETDADAANDFGREVRLLLPRMGGPLGHGQRFGNYALTRLILQRKYIFCLAKPRQMFQTILTL